MEFQKFDKIPRLSRDCVITEKIDGTNAQICIMHEQTLREQLSQNNDDSTVNKFIEKYSLGGDGFLYLFAGSRNRWLDCSSDGDNHGFAKWVKVNAEELLKLGEGRHYGEWWGQGINRGYGIEEKRFSLFNVGRWIKLDRDKGECLAKDSKIQECPSCCHVIPILAKCEFDTTAIEMILHDLELKGSKASSGFMNPEGIVIYHKASGQLFKKTIVGDEKPKSK